MGEADAALTLSEIARLAGVGLATASRALNGAPGVAAATRERVLEVAARHSYVVSPDAANLAGGATRRVAVVVPHLSRWFFGAMVEGLESVLRDAQLDVLLYHVGDEEDRRDFFERLPARRKVDAVIVVAFQLSDVEQRRFELMGVDIVAAGGQHAAYPHVCIDDEAAASQAVNHLIGLGHERIAMIEAIDPDQPTLPSERSRAYYRAFAEKGLPVDTGLVVSVDWGSERGAAGMAELLSRGRPFTAVFAHSDEVALGALRTLRRVGLRVPEDVSVVGIDDHPLADMLDLTTVRQPVYEQGVIAAETVLALLQKRPVEASRVVATTLVVRRSTARLAPPN